MLTFIYSTSVLDQDEETFNRLISDKVNLTNATVQSFNELPDIVKNKLKRDTVKLQKLMQYGEDYTMYDEKLDKLVFNKMAYLYENAVEQSPHHLCPCRCQYGKCSSHY